MAACTLYNLCFFVYIWLMPVFLKFLIRAPSNFDTAPFYPVPMRTLSGDVPDLYMSSFPQTTRPGVNHCRPCQELGGQRSGMYQWDIMLSISEKDLIKESKDKPVSTMYPLVFASNDAKTWKVVADADDVAGKGHWAGKNNDADEATHLSAPLLVANLKNFGCIDDETVETDPFFHHFTSTSKARQYKWRLVKHVAMHGSVNLVACVMQGMDDMNQLIHTYARDCIYQGEMKCHLTARQALGKCFAIGSACGQACDFFSPNSPVCKGGLLNPKLFEGLTHRRVKIKTSPGGGGAGEALKTCSKQPCNSGLHFNNMYVEAENPIEFLKAQMDVKNKEKGSYYAMIFAMSDFHAPMHTYEVVDDEEDEDEDEDEDSDKEATHHHTHHLHHGDDEEEHHNKHSEHEKEDEDDSEEGDEEKTKTTPKPKPKKTHKRTCVDLPGIRLGEIEHSNLESFVGKEKTDDALGCTAWCGQHASCQQSVFAQVNKGCYLFKIPTVEVKNYSALFNSSYCGNADTKELMMTMLHQAYKNYVPPAPPKPLGPPLRRLAEDELYAERMLQAGMMPAMPPEAVEEEISPTKRFYWQVAHVPNGTRGVLTDQGANEVRVIPRNTSCFTTPGFVYMVACMTGKPVYVPDRTHELKPPPFNDRCLAVGGLCGATCGSGQKVNDNVAKYCPLGGMGTAARRLQGSSPYASAHIPKEMLVQPIHDQRNSNQQSSAARMFFNLFIIISTVSFVSTVLNKFPGNFRDRHPIHTWDEIRTHGYVLDKFGSAVTASTAAAEDKTVVIRSWVGKITTRPESNDSAFPTFSKWVDVFCDEGHREGARILWMAWTDFLDTSPPAEFLQEWSAALRELAPSGSPFDLKWANMKNKKVLPVVPGQASAFGDDAPQGGVTLQPDSLAKLRDLAEVFRSLPSDLSADVSLPRSDDVVLTRRVMMDLKGGNKSANCYTISYGNAWQLDLGRKTEQRWKELNYSTKDKYEKALSATDTNGRKISAFGPDASKIKQAQFPLHFREPPARKDRQVIMIYCARARPEADRKGIEKTRGMDKYLWASLRPNAVRKAGKDGSTKRVYTAKKPRGAEEERPLLNDEASERSWSSLQSGDIGIFDEVKRCVEGAVERQRRKFLDEEDGEEKEESQTAGPLSGPELQRELTKGYLRHRTVDSDWEMARFCNGEVVGMERDADGDEVVILDNPSPALLELVGDPPPMGGSKSSVGLVSLQDAEDKKDRTVRTVKPSLSFTFVNTKPDGNDSGNFQKELSKKLQQALADPTLDTNSLKFQEKKKGNQLVVDITGPSKTIEGIRARNIRNLEVLSYRGRMLDTHPCIAVKKELLMPFYGVRGRSGGLNYVVDLLQFREGFIGTGSEGDPTPERMLMGVLDSENQPHPDFWKRCFPKFMTNVESGYTYKVNDEIALVQAPLSSGQSDADGLMGVSLSILNMIRGRCGGVTGCGTNEVWQISAKRFSRVEDEAAQLEFFQTQTLLHGTATTHAHFSKGLRSVYVPEKVATGMPKANSESLAEMQMNAEGAVQLFWVELLVNRSLALLKGVLAILVLLALMWLLLDGPTTKDIIGYSWFCDADNPSILLGSSNFCAKACDLFGLVLGRNHDKVTLEMAQHDYMELIDMGLCWFVGCLVMMVVVVVLAWKGVMPAISRILIMLENITYWMTSWNIFYWLALVLFMVIGMDPPLMFDGGQFMAFALLINLTQSCMLSEWKALSDCTEISIWRSQQSYALAAPLYLSAVVQGTINAWHIITGKRDCSYWSSTTTKEVVTNVTVWVTFIWVAFACCLCAIVAVNMRQLVLSQTPGQLQGEEHFSAAFLIGLIAITVQEPFLSLWSMDRKMEALTKNEKSGKVKTRLLARFVLMWRSKAWILRYIIDFVLPILVICGVLPGSHMLITLVAYGGTVHGLRV